MAGPERRREAFGRGGRDKTLRPVGKGALAIALVISLVLGVMAGGILGYSSRPDSSAATSKVDYLYLTESFNPANGHDEFFPGNFTVPAGVPVVITITEYDNGTNPVPASLGQVRGTVGGTATVTNASGTQQVNVVSPEGVTHTFTILQGPYNVNVPLPVAGDLAHPTIVTFTVVFGTTGLFAWHCLSPCDPVSMVTPGYMFGTITVGGG